MQHNMLTADDKKFILMTINDGMVELAGTTANLIEGVSAEIKEVRKDLEEVKKDVICIKKDVACLKTDVSFLKQQTIQTNEGLTVIRRDLVSLHSRVDYLEQTRADRINDADYDPNLLKK